MNLWPFSKKTKTMFDDNDSELPPGVMLATEGDLLGNSTSANDEEEFYTLPTTDKPGLPAHLSTKDASFHSLPLQVGEPPLPSETPPPSSLTPSSSLASPLPQAQEPPTNSHLLDLFTPPATPEIGSWTFETSSGQSDETSFDIDYAVPSPLPDSFKAPIEESFALSEGIGLSSQEEQAPWEPEWGSFSEDINLLPPEGAQNIEILESDGILEPNGMYSEKAEGGTDAAISLSEGMGKVLPFPSKKVQSASEDTLQLEVPFSLNESSEDPATSFGDTQPLEFDEDLIPEHAEITPLITFSNPATDSWESEPHNSLQDLYAPEASSIESPEISEFAWYPPQAESTSEQEQSALTPEFWPTVDEALIPFDGHASDNAGYEAFEPEITQEQTLPAETIDPLSPELQEFELNEPSPEFEEDTTRLASDEALFADPVSTWSNTTEPSDTLDSAATAEWEASSDKLSPINLDSYDLGHYDDPDEQQELLILGESSVWMEEEIAEGEPTSDIQHPEMQSVGHFDITQESIIEMPMEPIEITAHQPTLPSTFMPIQGELVAQTWTAPQTPVTTTVADTISSFAQQVLLEESRAIQKSIDDLVTHYFSQQETRP